MALVLVACGSDPSLHVTVTHPDGAQVSSTTITVYESSSLSCDDVAFAKLTTDQLDAVAVTAETIESTGQVMGGLTGISRTDHKVVVARGFDAMGKLATAGCGEVDVIDGTKELAIATVSTVTVSLLLPDPTSSDPLAVSVAATDPAGKAVSDRAISWTVYGPAGSMPLRAAGVTSVSDGVWEPAGPSCTASGLVKIHPVPPGVIGGYAVQMRVAWATELPAIYTSLGNANLALTTFTPPAGSARYCAPRINGSTHRLTCLDGSGAGVTARDYEMQVAGGAATLVEKMSAVIAPEATAIVSVPSGSDRYAYAVTTHGFLIPLFGAPAPGNTQTVCPPLPSVCATPVDDAIVLPPCGALPAQILMHTSATGPGQLVQTDPLGNNLVDYPLPQSTVSDSVAQLDRAGCVTTLDPNGGTSTLRQVTSINMGRTLLNNYSVASTHVSYDCSGGGPMLSCSSIATAPGASVGFTTGTEPRMIMTSVDATGVIVLQVVMAKDTGGKDHFIERSRAPAASLPGHTVVGEFDTDSTTDMFFDVAAKRGGSFEIAYARMIGDQPLEALSPQQTNLTIDDIIATDLTGDGLDDIVITGGTDVISGIAAVAMDVPAATAVPAMDPTCTP